MLKRIATFLAIALFAVTASVNAKDDPKGHHFATIAVHAEKATEEVVQSAIVKAALGRGWQIISNEDGVVKVHLMRRGYDANLTFVYTKKEIKIYSDSYTVKKTGERKSQKDPVGWIENLQKDIPVFIDRQLYL